MGPIPEEFENIKIKVCKIGGGGGGGGNRMDRSHLSHNIPCLPPEILHQHCIQFLLRRH